jgi:hypothetical protein
VVVRGNDNLCCPSKRQIRPQRAGIDRIVIDQQNAIALVSQPLHDRRDRRVFLCFRIDPAKSDTEPDQIGTRARLGLGPDPPCRAVVKPIPLGISRRQHRLADATQSVQRGDRDPAVMGRQRLVDCVEFVVPPHELNRHADRNVRDRSAALVGDGSSGGTGLVRIRYEGAEAFALLITGNGMELEANQMTHQHGYRAVLNDDGQNKVGTLDHRLVERGVEFHQRMLCLEVSAGDDAKRVIGCVEAFPHPGDEVAAARDLIFVKMRLMTKRPQHVGDPMSLYAVGRSVADEDVRHVLASDRLAFDWRSRALLRFARFGATSTPKGFACFEFPWMAGSRPAMTDVGDNRREAEPSSHRSV